MATSIVGNNVVAAKRFRQVPRQNTQTNTDIHRCRNVSRKYSTVSYSRRDGVFRARSEHSSCEASRLLRFKLNLGGPQFYDGLVPGRFIDGLSNAGGMSSTVMKLWGSMFLNRKASFTCEGKTIGLEEYLRGSASQGVVGSETNCKVAMNKAAKRFDDIARYVAKSDWDGLEACADKIVAKKVQKAEGYTQKQVLTIGGIKFQTPPSMYLRAKSKKDLATSHEKWTTNAITQVTGGDGPAGQWVDEELLRSVALMGVPCKSWGKNWCLGQKELFRQPLKQARWGMDSLKQHTRPP